MYTWPHFLVYTPTFLGPSNYLAANQESIGKKTWKSAAVQQCLRNGSIQFSVLAVAGTKEA